MKRGLKRNQIEGSVTCRFVQDGHYRVFADLYAHLTASTDGNTCVARFTLLKLRRDDLTYARV